MHDTAPSSVIPAKAGIQPPGSATRWIPGQARNDVNGTQGYHLA